MYSIAYVSTAAKAFSDDELDALLEESRDWNQKVEITGLLLYKPNNFMQFLEGPKEAVLEILGKIRRDPRHHSMIVLTQQERSEREFGNWSMGFHRLDHDGNVPRGFSDNWELPFSREEFLTDPTRALQFLLSFKTQTFQAVDSLPPNR